MFGLSLSNVPDDSQDILFISPYFVWVFYKSILVLQPINQ